MCCARSFHSLTGHNTADASIKALQIQLLILSCSSSALLRQLHTPQRQYKATHLLTFSTYTPGHDMKMSYPAPHSTPGPSLTSAIPTIVIHPSSPGLRLPQLHPGLHALVDGSVSRAYDDYSVSGRLRESYIRNTHTLKS